MQEQDGENLVYVPCSIKRKWTIEKHTCPSPKDVTSPKRLALAPVHHQMAFVASPPVF